MLLFVCYCSYVIVRMLLFVCYCSYCSSMLRSSCLQMFLKIGDLKHFVIFTGKYLCRSLFVINFTPKAPKTLQHRCSPVNIAQLLRTPFLQNTSGGYFCSFKIRKLPRIISVEASYIYLCSKYD